MFQRKFKFIYINRPATFASLDVETASQPHICEDDQLIPNGPPFRFMYRMGGIE